MWTGKSQLVLFGFEGHVMFREECTKSVTPTSLIRYSSMMVDYWCFEVVWMEQGWALLMVDETMDQHHNVDILSKHYIPPVRGC